MRDYIINMRSHEKQYITNYNNEITNSIMLQHALPITIGVRGGGGGAGGARASPVRPETLISRAIST